MAEKLIFKRVSGKRKIAMSRAGAMDAPELRP